MADGSPPSAFLRDALGYLDSLRLLIAAKDAGTLADPDAIERTIARTEAAVAHVLGVLKP
jgi:hypothetical protein